MKCKACPYFIWMQRKEEGSKTIEVRLSCEREKRQIGHDELDKNGCPIWCPLNKKNDKKQAEDYQRSENVPQGKWQNSPEMPDSIAGIPVSDLLFIAQIRETSARIDLYPIGQPRTYPSQRIDLCEDCYQEFINFLEK